MTSPVQIPADVDREDRLLGELTARQLIILTATGLVVYLVWTVTGPTALIVFAISATPLVLAGLVLAFGRRDGVSADRLLWAALTQRRQTPRAPRPLLSRAAAAAETDPRRAAVARRGRRSRARGAGRAVAARVPARRVLAAGADLGVLDLGRDGWAVVSTVTAVNFTLRSGPERDALLVGFARWLHSLAYPVQILTRTHPVDLSATIGGLRRDAAGLPHPALTAAAAAHADHLQLLGCAAELLHREFLIVFRTPAATAPTRTRTRAANGPSSVVETAPDRATQAAITQLRRRAEEAVALLGGIGLRVTPLDPAEATRVLRSATRPDLAATVGAVSAQPTPVMPAPAMPAPPPRPTTPPQPTAAHGWWPIAAPGSARMTPPRRGGTPPGGIGLDDKPTIELDITAAAVRGAGPAVARVPPRSGARRAINSDLLRATGSGHALPHRVGPGNAAAAEPTTGSDDDEIERANTAPAAAGAADPADAPAIAAAITASINAALDPRRTTAAPGDVAAPGDGAVAEDMTLEGDEDPDSDQTLSDQTLGGESRHEAATSADAPPAGSPQHRASRPIGHGGRGGPSARSTAARRTGAGRGPAPRSTRHRP
jgi:PrgI family protein